MIEVGWALFALSGVMFLIVAIRAGDLYGTIGCLLWLAAIACFLVAERRD